MLEDRRAISQMFKLSDATSTLDDLEELLLAHCERAIAPVLTVEFQKTNAQNRAS
jgi:hypothetical protein